MPVLWDQIKGLACWLPIPVYIWQDKFFFGGTPHVHTMRRIFPKRQRIPFPTIARKSLVTPLTCLLHQIPRYHRTAKISVHWIGARKEDSKTRLCQLPAGSVSRPRGFLWPKVPGARTPNLYHCLCVIVAAFWITIFAWWLELGKVST